MNREQRHAARANHNFAFFAPLRKEMGGISGEEFTQRRWRTTVPSSQFLVPVFFICLLLIAIVGCQDGSNTIDSDPAIEDPNNPVIDGLKIGDVVAGKGVLVWRDEFNGSDLDTAKWNYDYGNGSQYGQAGWGNNEKVWYMSHNVSVADGTLIIEARKDPELSGGANPYSAGKITTKGTKNHDGTVTYPPKGFLGVSTGCVEARIKAPRGEGFWPAFWMLGANVDGLSGYPSVGWPRAGEIDIFEMRGDRIRNGQTIHYQADSGHRYSGYGYDVPGIADNFHVYGVAWNDTQARFYCDGALKNTVNYSQLDTGAVTSAFHDEVPWALIINFAVSGNYVQGAVPPDAVFGADAPVEDRRLRVDWVRVWE